MAKNSNKKNITDNKYNAENEIIIGVTTKPKEKVRVKKKATRTNTKPVQNKLDKANNSTKMSLPNKKRQNRKNKVCNNKIKNNTNRKVIKKEITKEEEIKRINTKKIIISIIIVLFIVLCGTIYYITTPVFNVINIEVFGNEKNTVEVYKSLSKINIETTNIFSVTSNGIRKNLKENPYVEDVTIQRKLPNTIQIYVTERKVSYQLEYSNNYIYLDNKGYILEISGEKKNVPVIVGFSTVKENIQAGQRLKEEDSIKMNTVVKIINYCKYNTIENEITTIDVTDDTNYVLKFEKDKKIVYLGNASNLSERLSLLKTILKNEKNKEIEIFMNGNINEDEVYIRYVRK